MKFRLIYFLEDRNEKINVEGETMELLTKNKKEKKHRLIILTDMENEPDDSQTMVKLLMYSNEIDIEGLIAVTSRWLQDEVYPESIYDRVKAYGIVRGNLTKHASGWPKEDYLLSKVGGGQQGFGMEAVGEGKDSRGSELIIKAVDRNDPRPVYVAINAGANTLAQALWKVKNNRSKKEVDRFIAKIRVYDDSGQDDAGAWICHNFPEIFYIRSRAQVFGLFGPKLDSGPQPWKPLDQFEWVEENIRRRHGILGALYPQRFHRNGKYDFMEGGGTTTWIGLVNKGLYGPEHISWGGWGGRFSWKKEQVPAGQYQVDEMESPYEPFLMYPEVKDYSWKWEDNDEGWNRFSGVNGDIEYTKETFAPLWRWRDAYTRDFKGRMDWCVKDYEDANHHPEVALFGDKNRTILRAKARPVEIIKLDASASSDPDGDTLRFNWYIYPEAGTYHYQGEIDISDNKNSIAELKIPEDAAQTQIHVILEVTDDNQIVNLTSYRRLVIDVD